MTHGIFGNAFWWQSESEPHEAVGKFIQVLRDEQDSHYNDIVTFMGLYNGRPVHSRSGHGSMHNNMLKQPRLTFNIIHSLCQAAASKIAKHRPAVSFLTEGGSYSQKRKSKLFKKLMQGQFYSMKMYPTAQKVFLDACITGTGVIKYHTEFGKIKAERVPVHELTIDPIEAETGDMPRQMFQTQKVSRHVIAQMYPDKKDEILSSDASSSNEYMPDSRFSDMIECHEAWHLPSGPDADDGRHVICTDKVTLLDAPWEKDHFPFTFIRWTDNPTSFWGNGLAKEVKGIQVEINKLLARIQEQMHLSTPKVFIEDSSKIVQAHLSNKIWGAIRYRGTPPQFFVPRSVDNAMFSHLDRLVDRAYEMTGISQLAAQSKKPVGLESGRALREFSDIESERFMVVGQAYEQLFMDAAEKIINLIRDAYIEKDEYVISSFDSKSGLEKIEWSEINLEDDEYIIQIRPIGSLPQTPSAKLASVSEMHMNGFFSTEEAHQLLDFPDLQKSNNLKVAHIEVLDLVIEKIIEKGKYTPPEPYMNLELGIQRVQQAYNMAIMDEVTEPRKELLRRWITQANGLIEEKMLQAKEAAAPAGPPPGAMPGAPPAPPPPGMMPPGAPPQGMGPPGGPGAGAIPPELLAQLAQ